MREKVLYEFLLDLRKAYDALDREHCMEIIVSYGVVPQTEILLHHYSEELAMVAWVG